MWEAITLFLALPALYLVGNFYYQGGLWLYRLASGYAASSQSNEPE